MQNIPKIIEESINVLQNKFGAVGVDLWNVLVMGERIESIGGFCLGIIFAILSFFCFQKIERQNDDNNNFFYFLGVIIFFFMSFLFVCLNFVGMFVPEYSLLMSLMGK